MPQLFGELLEQEEAAAEAAIEECPVQRAHATSAPHREHAPLAWRERHQVVRQRAVECGELGAGQGLTGRLEQPLGGRVGQRHAAVEVEHDDAAGRFVQDAGQKVLLLLQLDALSAQRVHHPVVDVNQPIDVGLLRPRERAT